MSKKILFDKITITNFLSVGKEPLEINFKEGFNIITGINRDENGIKNGIGKTLIVDALYFAIFGETLRNLSQKKFIVNRQTGKNCSVKLAFREIVFGKSYNWVIERTLAPSACSITCNGEVLTESTMAETNKKIKDILGADETLFQNCIIMRANATVPFMAKKNQEKKDFIESIFRLEIFSDMQKKMKEDIRNAKKELDILNSSKQLVENNIVNYNSEISRQLEEAQNKDKEIAQQIDKIRREIKNEKTRLEELKQQSGDAKTLKSELDSTQKNLADAKKSYDAFLKGKYELETTISLKSTQLKELNNAGNVCPTCKREFSEEHKVHLQAQKDKLSAEIKDLNRKYSKKLKVEPKAKEILQQLTDEVALCMDKLAAARSNSEDIKRSQALVDRLEKQLEIFAYQKKENNIKSLEKLVEAALKQKKELESSIAKWMDELSMMTKCEHILGEYGVRSYIVEKLLGILNERISYYLAKFKSLFHFEFNSVFEESIVDSNGVSCQYGNCSGAESKKIDLAIAFAFSDVLKLHQKIEYNLIFFDEILDSSLDTQSLSHVIEFLHSYIKENDKAAYLITHKSDLDLPEIDETIMLEKKNGLTRRWLPPKAKFSA